MTLQPGRIVVVRHGETEWSRAHRHTGRTDIGLTAEGEARARALESRLSAWRPVLALTSPLARARRTAELAGLHTSIEPDLAEWDYGSYEGRTTAQIQVDTGDPTWSVWTTTTGLGETIGAVGERVDRVLARARTVTDLGSDVVLVAHAHVLRILAARWIGLEPADGRSFVLAPAGVGILGHERLTPVIEAWNG